MFYANKPLVLIIGRPVLQKSQGIAIDEQQRARHLEGRKVRHWSTRDLSVGPGQFTFSLSVPQIATDYRYTDALPKRANSVNNNY